jgi:hypothetical protein
LLPDKQRKEKQMMEGKTKVIFVIGLIVALFVLSTPIYGQQKGGMGYFIGGVGWFMESGNSSIVYSAGGGGNSIIDKWIIGGEGHSSFGSENAGGYGFFNVGYLLSKKDFLLVYPMLGLGGGAMTSEISSTVSKCALLKTGFGLDFLIPIKNNSGILLGVHGDYTFTIHNNNTFNWSMPHIRIVTGGYGFEE